MCGFVRVFSSSLLPIFSPVFSRPDELEAASTSVVSNVPFRERKKNEGFIRFLSSDFLRHDLSASRFGSRKWRSKQKAENRLTSTEHVTNWEVQQRGTASFKAARFAEKPGRTQYLPAESARAPISRIRRGRLHRTKRSLQSYLKVLASTHPAAEDRSTPSA